jgi:type II secretory pathway pseudopilin PulG
MQSGATLVELLVSLVIIGLALILVVGTFSTGLLNATLAKRNTAVEAALQYEMDKISGSPFDPSSQPYSECFATETSVPPARTVNFQDPCDSSFSLRADVSVAAGPTATSQTWTVTMVQMPAGAQVGSATSFYKVSR